jgi:hypothetical protein
VASEQWTAGVNFFETIEDFFQPGFPALAIQSNSFNSPQTLKKVAGVFFGKLSLAVSGCHFAT